MPQVEGIAAPYPLPNRPARNGAQQNGDYSSASTQGAASFGQSGRLPPRRQNTQHHWAELVHDDTFVDDMPSGTGGLAVDLNVERPFRPQHERIATRTLQLCNLPDNTTHADITSVVRGGMLLEVYIKYNTRSAQVSFLNSTDAQAFYDHVRRHDLYIRHKRASNMSAILYPVEREAF